MDVPDDIIKLLMEIVSPSSFCMLILTSKIFHITNRCISMRDIVRDALNIGNTNILDILLYNKSDRRRFVIIDDNRVPNVNVIKWLIDGGHQFNKDRIIVECFKNRCSDIIMMLTNFENIDKVLMLCCVWDNVYIIDSNKKYVGKRNMKTLLKIAEKHESKNIINWFLVNNYI